MWPTDKLQVSHQACLRTCGHPGFVLFQGLEGPSTKPQPGSGVFSFVALTGLTKEDIAQFNSKIQEHSGLLAARTQASS